MADRNILIQNLAQALNVDALNRSFVSESEIENGMIFASGERSTSDDEAEVFQAGAPEAGALTGLWMAYEPEVVLTVAGTNKQYKGLNPDPRDFFVPAGMVFSGFKPMAGDILTITGGGVLAGNYEEGTTTHVNATAGANTLTWGNSATADAFSMKLLNTSYVSVTDGSVLGAVGRVPAYTFEVVQN